MKAQELRIGNYFDRNGLMEVRCIGQSSIKLYDHVNNLFLPTYFPLDENIKGIPLTEEWLLKLGLLKNRYTFHMNSEKYKRDSSTNFYIRHKNKAFMPCTRGVGYCNPCMLKAIKYVHQLQNICFAITGNELTIE